MEPKKNWPVIAGSYKVGDPKGSVAVCALTSERLLTPLAGVPGVAIAGIVYTANLGITRIIMNITTNPAIRFLLVCGKDSNLFKPGQSLLALAQNGVDSELRIIGAEGYEPVMSTIEQDQITWFRRQVQVLDWTGEEDVQVLEQNIKTLAAKNPGPFESAQTLPPRPAVEQFNTIRPGGQREPLIYDPKGYFVITIDRELKEIVLRHYLPDHTPAHEMRGRGATSMVLGLLREGLITQLSHAGYLGEELAKAQTALQFGLRYDQDRPLRPSEPSTTPEHATTMPEIATEKGLASPTQSAPKMPKITIPMTWKQLEATSIGGSVDFVFVVEDLAGTGTLKGDFLEADEAEPFTAFRRNNQKVHVKWAPTSKFVMGTVDDLVLNALVRVKGTLAENNEVDASALVILTMTARILS